MHLAAHAPASLSTRPVVSMGWLAAVLMFAAVLLQFSGFDAALFGWAHARERLPPAFWAAATLLGFGWVVIILIAAMDRGEGLASALLLRVLVLASLATHLPKLLLAHPRPLAVLPPEAVLLIGAPVRHSGSMPSGHALALGAALGLFWILRGSTWQPWRLARWVVPIVVLVAAWSRVAVGAHWPADVLMGLGLGLGCALAAAAHEGTRPWAPRLATVRGQCGIAMLEVVAAVAWVATSTGYPQAVPLQWAIGGLALGSAMWRLRRILGHRTVAAGAAGAAAEGPACR